MITETKKKEHQAHQHHHGEARHRPKFTVESTPKQRFPLFEKNDFYVYDKKFYNELPKVPIPPKSFHYSYSNDNFSSFDIMTMMFGLKKQQEILTDPRLNTNIHKDFIDNSLRLIFKEQNLDVFHEQSTFEKNLSDNKNFKNEILDIIDTKDETDTPDPQSRGKNRSFYLRNSLILGSTLNVPKKSNSQLKASQHLKPKPENVGNLKKIVESTFDSIKLIKEGYKHPYKKNVTAKNVYDVKPLKSMLAHSFNQIIFPTDPSKDIENSNAGAHYNTFLLKKNDEDHLGLFKGENKSSNQQSIEEKLRQVNLFTYEKEYIANYQNPYELFNKYLVFMKKEDKVANFIPIDKKLFLKKYIRTTKEQTDEGEDANFISKKRERDVIVVPQNINEDEIHRKNRQLKDKGYLMRFVQQEFEADMKELETILQARENAEEQVVRAEEEEEGGLFNDSDNEAEDNNNSD